MLNIPDYCPPIFHSPPPPNKIGAMTTECVLLLLQHSMRFETRYHYILRNAQLLACVRILPPQLRTSAAASAILGQPHLLTYPFWV